MTFPDQGTPPDSGGQVPPAPQKEKEEDSGGGGFFAGIRQAAIDNYNGLYKIVLEPSMPENIIYWMGIIGVILGILWGWFAAPVVWTGSGPNGLSAESQEQWLKMVAVGSNPQNLYGPEQTIQLAQAVPNPRAQIEAMLADPELNQNDRFALQGLLNQLPPDVDATSAEQVSAGNPIMSFIRAWIAPIVLMIVIVIAGTLLWRLLIYDNLVAPVFQKIKEMRDPEARAEAERSRRELETKKKERELRDILAKDSKGKASDFGDPTMTQLAIYTPGRSFDESYEIELESGEFLGQSGAVLAEAVDPDPVAIEVWLFDMSSSKNITKIFVTPQGNADPAIRSRLEADVDNPATDIIVAEPGKSLIIDTDSLRLEGKFASLDFNANGRFENFHLQMLAWNKDAAGSTAVTPPPPAPAPVAPAGAPDMSTYDNISFDPPPPMPSSSPAGAPDMSTYDDIQFDPPPPMPSSSPAGAPDMSTYDDIQFDPPPPMPSGSSSPPPMTPLSPPPLRPQEDDNDDPFGGTGDFTPLGGS